MTGRLSRRDFLKLASLASAAHFMPPVLTAGDNSDLPNIILLVFDAWSAKNVSLYGYPRNTTPNLDRLAEKAIVYHNHYAAGHYTIPGTAGLLTGTLHWQHRLSFKNKVLSPFFRENNLFGLLPEYKRVAYTHNLLAHDVLVQMIKSMNDLKHWQDLYLWANPIQNFFKTDNDISSISWIRTMDIKERGASNSTFLSRMISYLFNHRIEELVQSFPNGLPTSGPLGYFILEDAIDSLVHFSKTEESPFLTYYHLLPPHDPYATRIDYSNKFNEDGFSPPRKPDHLFSADLSYEENQEYRQQYDEFILYVDAEIERLFSLLSSTDALENTWIILTSDHGETFERGLKAHKYPSHYDPISKVPLLIFPPGQKERIDIHTPTSAADILPTLLSIAAQDSPDWIEGQILPPFNQHYSEENPVFIIHSEQAETDLPYESGSMMVRQGSYKLIYHFGETEEYQKLEGDGLFELFDLKNDPEEIENLYDFMPEISTSLREVLFEKMKEKSVRR